MRAAPISTGVSSSAPVDAPRELRPFAQWVRWDYQPTKNGLTKVPHQLTGTDCGGAPSRPRPLVRAASTTDPTTWSPYELARRHPKIGFVFTRR